MDSILFNFFFADKYRILIIIFILIGISLFLFIIIFTCSVKSAKFKLVFIIMINVMISAILSAFGYIFNWIIEDKENDSSSHLLFESNALCQIQAFFLAVFQTSRESFVTFLSALILISLKYPNINFDKNKIILYIVLFLGYGIAIIASIIYMSLGVFGPSHLFCFTRAVSGTVQICGTLHFGYVFCLVILSFIFTTVITVKVTCLPKDDTCGDKDEEDRRCLDPILKKVIFYPFAQLVSMTLPFIYRFKDYFIHGKSTNVVKNDIAGPAAVLNSISSILYTLIFAISNNIYSLYREYKKNEKEEDNNEILLEIKTLQ